jgi:hypothetical protein
MPISIPFVILFAFRDGCVSHDGLPFALLGRQHGAWQHHAGDTPQKCHSGTKIK